MNRFLIVAAIGVLAGFLITVAMKPILIEYGNKFITTPMDTTSTILYSRNNVKLGNLSQDKRYHVSLSRFPKYVIDAVLAAEDKDFFSHSGISISGIVRAFFRNVFSKGGKIQGASTITQQLARDLYLSNERTLSRKVKEAAVSYALENRQSKNKILEQYLNRVYLGHRCYGFEAASLNYFRKSVSKLSLDEAAMLAGVIAAPSKYNPYTNFKLAKNRQQFVFNQMKKNLTFNGPRSHIKIYRPHDQIRSAPFYVQMLKQNISESYHGIDISGWKIISTYEGDGSTTKILRSHFPNNMFGFIKINPDTGAVLSIGSSYKFEDKQLNLATSAARPLGNVFYPFVIAAAIEQGIDFDLDGVDIFDERQLVQVFTEVGSGSMEKVSKDLGLPFYKSGYALATGRGLSSPLTLAVALSSFFGNRSITHTYFIESIQGREKQLLFEHKITPTADIFSHNAVNTIKSLFSNQLSTLNQKSLADGMMIGIDRNLKDGWIVVGNSSDLFVAWVGGKNKMHISKEKLIVKLKEVAKQILKDQFSHHLTIGKRTRVLKQESKRKMH